MTAWVVKGSPLIHDSCDPCSALLLLSWREKTQHRADNGSQLAMRCKELSSESLNTTTPVMSCPEKRSARSARMSTRLAIDQRGCTMIPRYQTIQKWGESQQEYFQWEEARQDGANRKEARSDSMNQNVSRGYDGFPEGEQTIRSPPPSRHANRSNPPSFVIVTQDLFNDVREREEAMEIPLQSALRIV